MHRWARSPILGPCQRGAHANATPRRRRRYATCPTAGLYPKTPVARLGKPARAHDHSLMSRRRKLRTMLVHDPRSEMQRPSSALVTDRRMRRTVERARTSSILVPQLLSRLGSWCSRDRAIGVEKIRTHLQRAERTWAERDRRLVDRLKCRADGNLGGHEDPRAKNWAQTVANVSRQLAPRGLWC